MKRPAFDGFLEVGPSPKSLCWRARASPISRVTSSARLPRWRQDQRKKLSRRPISQSPSDRLRWRDRERRTATRSLRCVWQGLEGSLPYRALSKYEVERANAGAMSAHDASSLLSTSVEPLRQGSAGQDRHYIVGHFSAWEGKCRSAVKLGFDDAPDAFVLYLPSTNAPEYVPGHKASRRREQQVFWRISRTSTS